MWKIIFSKILVVQICWICYGTVRLQGRGFTLGSSSVVIWSGFKMVWEMMVLLFSVARMFEYREEQMYEGPSEYSSNFEIVRVTGFPIFGFVSVWYIDDVITVWNIFVLCRIFYSPSLFGAFFIWCTSSVVGSDDPSWLSCHDWPSFDKSDIVHFATLSSVDKSVGIRYDGCIITYWSKKRSTIV